MDERKKRRMNGIAHYEAMVNAKPDVKASEEFHQKPYTTRKRRKKEDDTDGKEKRRERY